MIFLAAAGAFWVALPPPPPPLFALVLPIPVYQPIPAYVSPPAYIAPPPPNNIIYNNVHNTVIVNNTTNNVTIRNPAGQTTTQPIAVAARGPAPAAGAQLRPAHQLPRAEQHRPRPQRLRRSGPHYRHR